MESLPIVLKTAGRRILLVGGGEAARAKSRLLLKTDAHVVWIGAGADDELPGSPRLAIERRNFRDSDLDGMALVYGATGDAAQDARIATAARARGIPVNIVDRPELCDFTTPAIIDRSPLLVAISTGGAAPVLARRLRAMIEALLPAGIGRLVARAGGFRERLAALVPETGARRRFWDALFDSSDPEHLAALNGPAFNARLEALARAAATGESRGRVQLVGAGPGDPELLTLKAQRALQQADVVLYDRLVSDAVLDFARRDAEFVFVGKTRGEHGLGQDRIHGLMVAHARAGRHVVRLKSGDPFIFGRAGEEIAALREAGIEVGIIPGITAVAGCAASAEIPLTHRDHASAVTLVTGQVRAGSEFNWRALAGQDRTLAVYMGISSAEEIACALIGDGVDPSLPVAIIENGSRPEERRVYGRLARLPHLVAEHGIESPALIVIGAVAALARDWPSENLAPLLHDLAPAA